MPESNALTTLIDNPKLDRLAEPLSRAVRRAYEAAGPSGQRAKNALHGVWLRHPLHPVLTDVPLGAWTTALVLDVAAATNRDRGMERAADVAVCVGLCGAVAAAVAGLTDWSETGGRARRTGLVHGLLNITATAFYTTGYALRRNGSRAAGQTCTLAGYAVALSAAHLGGDLVYGQRIGVTHAAIEAPEDFTVVGSSSDVPDDSMRRFMMDGAEILVVRQHGRLSALAHPCAHLGGPLSEGTLKEGSVVCPWHGSEYALADGCVINGPSTHDQPVLEVREREGRIEVKARMA
jgi:nitrite reductase/ring-hydroxylating ferredoxin subunit/uncharacterized membrane protein